MPISQTLLPEFDQEMSNTRKMLERVPDDKFDYKPHEKSMTLGRLACHVAELPNLAALVIRQDMVDFKPTDPHFTAASRKELLDAFDKIVAEDRDLLAKATDEHSASLGH